MYVTPPESMDDLRQKITAAIQSVKEDENLIKRAVRDIVRRANKCIEVEGRLIEILLENK